MATLSAGFQSSIYVTAPADYTAIMISFADVETFFCSWIMTVGLDGGRSHRLKEAFCSLTPRPHRYDSRFLHVKYVAHSDTFSGLRMVYSFHKVCVLFLITKTVILLSIHCISVIVPCV